MLLVGHSTVVNACLSMHIVSHTHPSTHPHIPSTRQKFRQSYAYSLSVPLTHTHWNTQTQSSGGISLAGSASEMSGGFLQPVIKTADTSTSKPPLEYHLSEVQWAAEDSAYKPPCPSDMVQNTSDTHCTSERQLEKGQFYPARKVQKVVGNVNMIKN